MRVDGGQVKAREGARVHAKHVACGRTNRLCGCEDASDKFECACTRRGQGQLALRRCSKRGRRGKALLRAGVKKVNSLDARHKLRVKVCHKFQQQSAKPLTLPRTSRCREKPSRRPSSSPICSRRRSARPEAQQERRHVHMRARLAAML